MVYISLENSLLKSAIKHAGDIHFMYILVNIVYYTTKHVQKSMLLSLVWLGLKLNGTVEKVKS